MWFAGLPRPFQVSLIRGQHYARNMEAPVGDRILCTIRRHPLPLGFLHTHKPSAAAPEERIFDLYDGPGNKIGQLMYVEVKSDWYGVLRECKATTPWGVASITKETLRLALAGTTKIVIGDRVLATISGRKVSFPEKAVMAFKIHLGQPMMTYTGDTGSVSVTQKFGKDTVADASPGATPASDNPDSLTTEIATRSRLSEHYEDFIIRASGILPVDDDDVMRSLVMALSFNRLQFAQNPKAAQVGL